MARRRIQNVLLGKQCLEEYEVDHLISLLICSICSFEIPVVCTAGRSYEHELVAMVLNLYDGDPGRAEGCDCCESRLSKRHSLPI